MGRSVSVPANAMVVCYSSLELDGVDEELDFQFTIIDPFVDYLRELFPATYAVEQWLGREDLAVAANRFAWFGVSEYCGVVAYWIVPRGEHDALAERWISMIEPKFTKAFGGLHKLGTASNGEAFFQEIK